MPSLEPMSAWAEEWKAGSAITPPRGFAFAAYQIAPKQLLLVYGLHLKSNRGQLVEDIAIREESMRQLLNSISTQSYQRLIIPPGPLTYFMAIISSSELQD